MTEKIHRLLDEAFAGVDMTVERQDLKEEMRANLLVRVAELEDTGLSADEAARRAIAELGDIRPADLKAVAGGLGRSGLPSLGDPTVQVGGPVRRAHNHARGLS